MKCAVPGFAVFLLLSQTTFYQYSFGQVLNYETIIKIEGGRKTTEKTFQVLIKDKESNWLSHIEVNHGPDQDFTLLNAQVKDASGNLVRTLKKRDITTRSDLSSGAFYQDDLIEEFNLYWSEYPYQIDYSYRLVEKEFVYVIIWHPMVYTKITTLKSSLRLETPRDYKVAISSEEIPYQEFHSGDSRIRVWHYDQPYNVPAPEIYCPPLGELLPSVSVVPLEFVYGVGGSSESWSTFGAWQAKLNEGTDDLPASEKVLIDKLIENITDERKIISTLYYNFQDRTKYVNVAIDVGGLKSYPASYVCANRYGDCKALTTYMKSVLAYAGIKSYYTKVNAGSNRRSINRALPAQQFNHVILAIPLENDTIWLENTSNSLPVDYLGTFAQNRYALMVDEQNSKLVRTPALSTTDVLERRSFIFTSNDLKSWDVTIRKTLRGEAFEVYRHFKSQESFEDQRKKVQSDIEIPGFQMTEWSIEDSPRDSQEIDISATGRCSSTIREIGRLKAIQPLQIMIPEFEEPQERELGVRIDYPINRSDSIVLVIPGLSEFELQLPENINLTTNYGRYRATYRASGTTVVVQEHFVMNNGDYSKSEYPDFYGFIRSINDHRKQSTIFLK